MKAKPTIKQKIAIDLIGKGFSARAAMLKAGYSKVTASQPKKNLLSKPKILNIVDQMKLTLENEGIDGEFLAHKLAKMAKSENYKEFTAGYDRIKTITGIEAKQEEQIKKRELTLTEYLTPRDLQTNPETKEEVIPNNQDNLISNIIDTKEVVEEQPINNTESTLAELII